MYICFVLYAVVVCVVVVVVVVVIVSHDYRIDIFHARARNGSSTAFADNNLSEEA